MPYPQGHQLIVKCLADERRAAISHKHVGLSKALYSLPERVAGGILVVAAAGQPGNKLFAVHGDDPTGVSRILCKLKNAVQIEQIYSKGAARKSAVPFAVILAVNLPYVKDQ